MSETHISFEVPSGCPDIVTLGTQLWGEPTKRAKDKVEFGKRGSKHVCPAPANTWFDHEANSGGGYVELYKLKHGKAPDPPGFPIPPGMVRELGNPVAWWDYHDAHYKRVARVVRFHPPGAQDKTYRQCRPDGDRWRWKMQGLQIPLYHLPDLLKAPAGSIVYITEGEKHADLLREWGLLATTNAGGAKKFRTDHAAILARFECVVLPDNDVAGREHRDVVTKALRVAGCQRIRVVDLPNLPPKGDVIDWAAAGGTRQALEAMAAATPVWGNEPAPSPDADGVPAGDWSNPDEPPPELYDPGYIEAIADAQSFDPVATRVAEFNRKYMVVNDGGKTVIYEPANDPILKRHYYRRMEFSDLQKLYLNDTVRNGVDKKGEPVYNQVAQVWLRHRDRRQYIGGVTFDPSGNHDDPHTLNLWQGFAVKPKPGSWDRMKSHILNVICAGNREHRDYVLNWAARMVQFPAQAGDVAIVMKGVEGAGKGTLANALRRIMGQHALKISNAKHLVGNFNAHLRDCVFLFADEAFFAGDKAHVGVLKSLITEDSLTIEAKYQNAVETPNYLHLMMASNEEWVIPAGLEARRFLVLLCAATMVRNFAYFKAIHDELENGGYEAMLHDLLHKDLTGFDVHDVPETEGLQQQKKLSLATSESWWLDVLHRGYVWKSKLGLDDYFGEWHEVVATEVLYSSYSEFARAHGERHPMAREAFGRFMVDMGGQTNRPRDAVVGEHITDVQTFSGSARKAALIRSGRAYGYHLGSLVAARSAFVDATKLDVLWEAEEQEAA